jgi:hypothetical protein
MKYFSLLLVFAFAFSIARADEAADSVIKTSQPAAPATHDNWKTTYSSYFYNFQGTQAAHNDLYSFGDSTLAMQLLTVQYEINPKWSLVIIGSYLDQYVETNMLGMTFKDRTKGLGDTTMSAVTPLYTGSNFLLYTDVGASLPTGVTDFKNASNPTRNYAYNMQSGSGTFDAVLGLTPMYISSSYQLGSRLTAFVRNGQNSQGYRLGNLYRVDAWADMPLKYGFTPRLVGYYKHKDGIHGEDSTEPRDQWTEFYFHDQNNWDVSAAVKYGTNFGPVNLLAEVGVPVAQGMSNYDNVVVSTEYYANLSVSGAF